MSSTNPSRTNSSAADELRNGRRGHSPRSARRFSQRLRGSVASSGSFIMRLIWHRNIIAARAPAKPTKEGLSAGEARVAAG
jgi:hypothetical protein